jgi:hypothetical protein
MELSWSEVLAPLVVARQCLHFQDAMRHYFQILIGQEFQVLPLILGFAATSTKVSLVLLMNTLKNQLLDSRVSLQYLKYLLVLVALVFLKKIGQLRDQSSVEAS